MTEVPVKMVKHGPLREWSWEPPQPSGEDILAAVEYHWLTQQQQNARRLEELIHEAGRTVGQGAGLTLRAWMQIKSKLIIDQAIAEVFGAR